MSNEVIKLCDESNYITFIPKEELEKDEPEVFAVINIKAYESMLKEDLYNNN